MLTVFFTPVVGVLMHFVVKDPKYTKGMIAGLITDVVIVVLGLILAIVAVILGVSTLG